MNTPRSHALESLMGCPQRGIDQLFKAPPRFLFRVGHLFVSPSRKTSYSLRGLMRQAPTEEQVLVILRSIEHPSRPTETDRAIALVGANLVDYSLQLVILS